MWWLLIMSSLLGSSSALLPALGPCPDVKTVESLNMTSFMGKWFEAERYFSIIDFGAKCGIFNYSAGENGALKIGHSQISAITGLESGLNGIARPIARADDPKLTVSYPSLPIQYPLPHWVLGTDYDTFAVVWSCSDIGVFSSMKSAWILTRDRQPPIPVLEKAYQILDKNGISRAFFSRTDQKNCPTAKKLLKT